MAINNNILRVWNANLMGNYTNSNINLPLHLCCGTDFFKKKVMFFRYFLK